jgi:hypothetical protein
MAADLGIPPTELLEVQLNVKNGRNHNYEMGYK